MRDICLLTATEILQTLRSREISALELLDHTIQRIERLNPKFNAVVTLDRENARKRAVQADGALAKGQDWGPLHGLPITIKESIAVAGMPLSGGAAERNHVVPNRHAEVVQTLIDAGAVVFGKTNIPLFAMDFQSYNEVYGQTNNPWDLTRTSGGSSGGAAAAVAAGLSGLEIGSDVGGSIRVPAHFCGVFGHKPSFNIVPLQGHVPFPALLSDSGGGIAADILVIGPLARSAIDLQLAMSVIVRPADRDRVAWRIELPPPRRRTLKDYRIGVWLDDPASPVDSEVGACLQSLVNELSKLSPHLAHQRPAFDFWQSHEIYVGLSSALNGSTLTPDVFEKIGRERNRLGPSPADARSRFIQGATQDHRQWILLNEERMRLQEKWAAFFEKFDVLIMPAAPVAAFPHDHGPFYDRRLTIDGREVPYVDALFSWAGLAGVAYLPATVIPAGSTPGGLPVGIQIVGPYLEDRTTLHVASLIEEALGGYSPPPGCDG